MELELIEKKETPLLARTRAEYKISFESETPSRKAIRQNIAKSFEVDEKLVFIRHIYQRFGTRTAKVIAHIYKTENDARAIEAEVSIKKHSEKAKQESKEAAEAKAE